MNRGQRSAEYSSLCFGYKSDGLSGGSVAGRCYQALLQKADPAGPRGLSGGQFSPGVYKDLIFVLNFCLQPARHVPVLAGPCEIASVAWEQGNPNFLKSPLLDSPHLGGK